MYVPRREERAYYLRLLNSGNLISHCSHFSLRTCVSSKQLVISGGGLPRLARGATAGKIGAGKDGPLLIRGRCVHCATYSKLLIVNIIVSVIRI
jgi:hypothetical protein